MLQAMLAGVASIKAQQTRMNVIGNNLANINTTAYKSSRVTFQDMISQNLRGASRPSSTGLGGTDPAQIGLGVLIGDTGLNESQGSLSATNAPDNLAYRISKAALNMIARSIAFELHDDRILSIVVHPGWVRTEMGGPSAPTTASEAARAILAQIDAAKLSDSGEFLDTKGARCAW